MWVTKLLISPVKKGFFTQKRPKIGISDHCWLIWCPVGGLAGGCGARPVTRKTPIYFIEIKKYLPTIVLFVNQYTRVFTQNMHFNPSL